MCDQILPWWKSIGRGGGLRFEFAAAAESAEFAELAEFANLPNLQRLPSVRVPGCLPLERLIDRFANALAERDQTPARLHRSCWRCSPTVCRKSASTPGLRWPAFGQRRLQAAGARKLPAPGLSLPKSKNCKHDRLTLDLRIGIACFSTLAQWVIAPNRHALANAAIACSFSATRLRPARLVSAMSLFNQVTPFDYPLLAHSSYALP